MDCCSLTTAPSRRAISFTYEPASGVEAGAWVRSDRRKHRGCLHDLAVRGDPTADTRQRYALDLNGMLKRMDAGRGQEAHGQLTRLLARRVASTISPPTDSDATLYPVEIEIDNTSSEQYTVLHITAPDTIGFLYELFTNALALHHIYIARVHVESFGDRAHDSLFVTDASAGKSRPPKGNASPRRGRAHQTLLPTSCPTHLIRDGLAPFPRVVHDLFRQPNWPDESVFTREPGSAQAAGSPAGGQRASGTISRCA